MVEESGTLESQLEATKVSAPRAPGSAETLHAPTPAGLPGSVRHKVGWLGTWFPLAYSSLGPHHFKGSLWGLLLGALFEKGQVPLVLTVSQAGLPTALWLSH